MKVLLKRPLVWMGLAFYLVSLIALFIPGKASASHQNKTPIQVTLQGTPGSAQTRVVLDRLKNLSSSDASNENLGISNCFNSQGQPAGGGIYNCYTLSYNSSTRRYDGNVFIHPDLDCGLGTNSRNVFNVTVIGSNFRQSGGIIDYCAAVNPPTPFDASKPIRQTVAIGSSVTTTPAPSNSADPAAAEEDELVNCATAADKLAWMLCPVLNLLEDQIKHLTALVEDRLAVVPLSSQSQPPAGCPGGPAGPPAPGTDCNASIGLKAVWERIRDLANVSFVLIFLYIIFANTLSIQIDAYTIKKMLPKLVAATILVQFSFLLSGFIIDVGNVLGRGTSQIMTTVLNPVSETVSSTSTDPNQVAAVSFFLIGLISVAVISVVGIGVVMLTVLSAVVGLLIVFLTLVLRQLIIAIFVVISPIAIATWVLPNTDGFFNFWYKNFIRVILVFPIVVLILGMGALVGSITKGGGTLEHIIGAFFPIISFFLIPLAFRFAGGVLGAVTGTFSPGALRRKITGGQLAKDMRERQREKGLEKTMSDRTKGVKAFGFLQAGGGVPTRSSRRRVSGSREKLLRTQGDEAEAQFEGWGVKGEEFYKRLNAVAEGIDVHGVKANASARIRALEVLGKHNRLPDLRELRETTPTEIWNKGVKPNIGELIKSAPDIIKGKDTAFRQFSPDQFTAMDPTTVEELMGWLRTPAGQAYRPAAISSIRQAFERPGTMVRIGGGTAGHVLANAEVFKNVPTGIAGVDGENYLSNETTGKLVKLADLPASDNMPPQPQARIRVESSENREG